MKTIKGIFSIILGITLGLLSLAFGQEKQPKPAEPQHETKQKEISASEERKEKDTEKALKDWFTDYPKRPVKKGENLPFNRPTLE